MTGCVSSSSSLRGLRALNAPLAGPKMNVFTMRAQLSCQSIRRPGSQTGHSFRFLSLRRFFSLGLGIKFIEANYKHINRVPSFFRCTHEMGSKTFKVDVL